MPVWLDHLVFGGKSRRKPVFSFLGTGMDPLRTRVYIDGYNLYYGCLKGTRFKWLDLLLLFERHILPSILVECDGEAVRSKLLPLAIKYFTAPILEKAAKAQDSVASQARYHTALTKHHRERIECIKGYYSLTKSKAKIVDDDNPARWPKECQEILVWKLEEKQTDVNLALHDYHDLLSNQVDHAVVVTNDTDIVPALQMARKHTGAMIGLVIPTRDHQRIPNTDLAELAHWVRAHIRDEELAASQLPRVILGRKPTIKPVSWYARPDLLQQVLDLASPIRGGQREAFKWMEAKNEHLGGEAPIDLVETDEGSVRVLEYIHSYSAKNGID